ncbi:hypothetical protein FVER53263_20404 [Fusarium verticillioides]|nr:hypothetical protein FVER53263_20404 [Fusarium verticillioides]
MIPPPAVELLYDNNGGSFQHLSYCNDNPKVPCTAVFPNSEPCAYHICFKLCVWHFEHFVYARYDFHAQAAFVMIAGDSNGDQLRKVVTQFHGQRDIGLFDILLALLCQWAQEVEEMRWLSDFATQTYESQTGVSTLVHLSRTRVLPEKLRLRTEMVSTQDTLRIIARASEHVGELFEFLQNSLWRFHDVCTEHTGIRTSKRYYQQLYDTIEMRISQQRSQAAQIGNLKLRITSQWDICQCQLITL